MVAKAIRFLIAASSVLLISNSCYAETMVSTIAGTPGQSGHTDGPGTAATFHTPLAITASDAYLYVADTWNSTIRRIEIATNAVTTIAGRAGITGHSDGSCFAATFYTPSGITYDGECLYIADTGNHSIRRMVLATGVVSTVMVEPLNARNFNSHEARIDAQFVPYGITTDGANLYFTDPFFNTIRMIALSSGALVTIAGQPGIAGHDDGIGTAATFSSPMGIATDGTNLYISDGNNCAIRKIIIASGIVSTIAGRANIIGSDDGVGSSALFNGPTGLALAGNFLYVADSLNRTIRKIDLSTGMVETIAGRAGAVGHRDGSGDKAMFEGLGGLVLCGRDLYAADSLGHVIRRIRRR